MAVRFAERSDRAILPEASAINAGQSLIGTVRRNIPDFQPWR